MTNSTIKNMIIASNVYFFGTKEIDEVSKFWYGLFLRFITISLIYLIFAWIF